MDRILKGVASTISITWYVNGVATDPDPDSATVTITKDSDGTAVVTDAATTDVSGNPGVFSYTLVPAQVDELDLYLADWTATFNGEPQALRTEVEIAGGLLFTIAEARQADTELADTNKYPPARIIQGRTMAEQALEEACGVAFVPRYAKETTNGLGGTGLPLRWAQVRTVRSGMVDSTALSAADLTDIHGSTVGAYTTSGWTLGTRNVTVVYEHGYDRPPSRATRAAIRLCRHYLTQFSVDDRYVRVDSETGSFVMAGGDFQIPEVDKFIAAECRFPLVG